MIRTVKLSCKRIDRGIIILIPFHQIAEMLDEVILHRVEDVGNLGPGNANRVFHRNAELFFRLVIRDIHRHILVFGEGGYHDIFAQRGDSGISTGLGGKFEPLVRSFPVEIPGSHVFGDALVAPASLDQGKGIAESGVVRNVACMPGASLHCLRQVCLQPVLGDPGGCFRRLLRGALGHQGLGLFQSLFHQGLPIGFGEILGIEPGAVKHQPRFILFAHDPIHERRFEGVTPRPFEQAVTGFLYDQLPCLRRLSFKLIGDIADEIARIFSVDPALFKVREQLLHGPFKFLGGHGLVGEPVEDSVVLGFNIGE